MEIGINSDITKKKSGVIELTYKNMTFDSVNYDKASLERLYAIIARANRQDREKILVKALQEDPNLAPINEALANSGIDLENEKPDVKRGLEHLMNFFKDFQFDANFRFVNTFIRHLMVSEKAAKDYVYNYFALTDSPYINEVNGKLKSEEFKSILHDLSLTSTEKKINTRFKLYYGSQCTGKSYTAQKEADGRCVICNNGILPNDLMEDFAFDDGKPTFNGSILKKCMTEGLPVVLDEINLLPYETLRYLQGLLYGKTEFIHKNETIHIKDGFKIIGTMNLSINGMTYGLPEPLVDRCEEMKQFKLTADDLMRAI